MTYSAFHTESKPRMVRVSPLMLLLGVLSLVWASHHATVWYMQSRDGGLVPKEERLDEWQLVVRTGDQWTVEAAPKFMAAQGARSRLAAMFYEPGKYHQQEWNLDARKEIFDAWDPKVARSPQNFNPFEQNEDGNVADASGWFPGDTRYADPIRGDTDWSTYMKEEAIKKELKENPKDGDTPGAPGRLDAA